MFLQHYAAHRCAVYYVILPTKVVCAVLYSTPMGCVQFNTAHRYTVHCIIHSSFVHNIILICPKLCCIYFHCPAWHFYKHCIVMYGFALYNLNYVTKVFCTLYWPNNDVLYSVLSPL